MVKIVSEGGGSLRQDENGAPISGQRVVDLWAQSPVFSSSRTKPQDPPTPAPPISALHLSETASASLLESLGITVQGNSKLMVLVIDRENGAGQVTPEPPRPRPQAFSDADEAGQFWDSHAGRKVFDEMWVNPKAKKAEAEPLRLPRPTSKHLSPPAPQDPLILTDEQRTDLVRLVRPTAKHSGQRPRPLPLLLIQEQRIDRTVDNVAMDILPANVHPRRF